MANTHKSIWQTPNVASVLSAVSLGLQPSDIILSKKQRKTNKATRKLPDGRKINIEKTCISQGAWNKLGKKLKDNKLLEAEPIAKSKGEVENHELIIDTLISRTLSKIGSDFKRDKKFAQQHIQNLTSLLILNDDKLQKQSIKRRINGLRKFINDITKLDISMDSLGDWEYQELTTETHTILRNKLLLNQDRMNLNHIILMIEHHIKTKIIDSVANSKKGFLRPEYTAGYPLLSKIHKILDKRNKLIPIWYE